MPAEFFLQHTYVNMTKYKLCVSGHTDNTRQPGIDQHMPAEFFAAIHRYVNVTKYELFVSGYTHNQA